VQFKLKFTTQAKKTLEQLKQTDSKKFKKVAQTLGKMETNLRHPSLQTHQYHSISGKNGEKVFESYVENKTPAAFRVFWYYGPESKEITILAITPHP
jgi:mRNA-degrading endonuclease RelE of RelBE toxin-antitoxin system